VACTATAGWIDATDNLAPLQLDGSAPGHRPATDLAQTTDGNQSPHAGSPMLSLREWEVLGYAPSMLSAAQIGTELFVSANTVKAHLRSIYRKLGVNRRRDAVDEARWRGLL
jgi:LuxR family transcriptional regulator, maltose regulon positive regulatory protein